MTVPIKTLRGVAGCRQHDKHDGPVNNLFLFVLLSITFGFGLVVGDAWTPISGASTHAISVRCAALEARVAELEARCAKLEASFGSASTRLEEWLTQRPAPWVIPAEDGGMKVVTFSPL